MCFLGYESTSSLSGIAYRADMFPGLGFVVKRAVYEQNMKHKMADCCSSKLVAYMIPINEHRPCRHVQNGYKIIGPDNSRPTDRINLYIIVLLKTSWSCMGLQILYPATFSMGLGLSARDKHWAVFAVSLLLSYALWIFDHFFVACGLLF